MTNTRDPLVLVYARNAFYRRLYYLAFTAYSLSVIVIAILVSVLFYLINHPTRPLYFATDNVGRLIHVVPVNTPNMTYDEVVAWAIDAVQTAYSYDYINYREQLQNSEKYFTSYGWDNFIKALTASNNLVALKERQMIVLAKVVGTPTVERQGMMGGAYAWRFKMPILINYSLPPFDAQHQFSNALEVSMIVQRQQALQGYKGLGVVQMIATLATAPTGVTQDLPTGSPPTDTNSNATPGGT